MTLRKLQSLILALALLPACSLAGAGRSPAPSYRVGDRIESETFVLDREGNRHRLVDLIPQGTRVSVLILFGGAVKTAPEPMRGRLWCEDSFDDLAVQRALVAAYQGQPVRFLAVAVPPVYHTARYGYEGGVFLDTAPDNARHREEVAAFIASTERERENGTLPFPEIFYDPKFRLAHDLEKQPPGKEYGPVYGWQGRFKWHQDHRRYGTPTLWLIGPEGRILHEPFWGNDYDSIPPQVFYDYRDIKNVIDQLLE